MDAGRYDAAARDPDFRARLEAAFTEAGGEGAVVDELWWRERAQRPHPAGLRDPASEREALVEATYSEAGSEQDARDAAARLRAFETRRRRQEDALDAALALTAQRRGRKPGAASSRPLAAARRHPVLLSVTALVAAAALGAVATTTTTSLRSTETPVATTAAELPASPSVLSRALSRVQVPTDAVPTPFRADIDPRSSRLLYDDDPSGGDAEQRWRLWIGTGENPRQLCFVSSFDNVTDTVSCVPSDRAFSQRFILSQRTEHGSFEALIDDGAVAVQVG
ncbi:hypothetical protein GCM10025867_23500 [Frondihabitans sucicola]|uniref:Anti-sigma factor n=1 Tax=Frondihabitans sucicola TaxID=1268041 RepID=A0ABM8GNT5_9MICO|nr:hypothetical protein [Frondihabitans sucicola]BDZ50109.1 hypothetical protein GCM10025867_23500 [Frondihabitans sucicola]